jgi:hypothetical protein
MATQTKTVSGNTTTYVITDLEGATVTVALTQGYGSGRTCTFASSGNVHQDGQQMLVTLMQMVSTGLTP